jgi:hypothetical protein
VDPSKLGRWSWMRLRGKSNLTLHLATVYHPVVSAGATSAYQQQRQWLYSKDIDTCPRAALLSDLATSITEWQQEGDQILVISDFNEYVQGPKLLKFFSQFDMKELFFSKHSPVDLRLCYCHNQPNSMRLYQT